MSETEIKLFQPLKLFQNNFSIFQNSLSYIEHVEKYPGAAISLMNNFEISLGKLPCTAIKLFQTDVDEG